MSDGFSDFVCGVRDIVLDIFSVVIAPPKDRYAPVHELEKMKGKDERE